MECISVKFKFDNRRNDSFLFFPVTISVENDNNYLNGPDDMMCREY